MTSVLFQLKKFISMLMLPPVAPLLVVAAGLVLLRWRRRLGMGLAWGGLAVNLLLAMPAAAGWLTQQAMPANLGLPSPADLASAGAIVVPTAGAERHLRDYGGETVDGPGLERARAAARLARQTGLPVLVSGGLPREGQSLAALTAQAIAEFGAQVRWLEAESRDTAENAGLSARLLAADGVSRVVLVTHALHMGRAAGEFRMAGLEVIPAPTLLPRPPDYQASDFWPNIRAYRESALALHELLGQAAQALRRLAR